MKKLIIALVIIFAATPVFATQWFGFDNAIDTAGWSAVWNSGGNQGPISLSIVGGRLQVTITKDSATADGVNVRYGYGTWGPAIQAGDTCWSIWGRSVTPIQPPWCYTKCYSRDSNWTWHDGGIQANMAATFQQFANIRSPMGPIPYRDIGFQIYLGTITGTYTFEFDNGKFGGDLLIPVELIDFEATAKE